MPFGRGFGPWAFGAYGYYGGFPHWGWGRGRGNPFPFCRNFPWLPRWWWVTPYASQYAATIPYYGFPFPAFNEKQELEFLRQQKEFLEGQLNQIKAWIAELEEKKG